MLMGLARALKLLIVITLLMDWPSHDTFIIVSISGLPQGTFPYEEHYIQYLGKSHKYDAGPTTAIVFLST